MYFLFGGGAGRDIYFGISLRSSIFLYYYPWCNLPDLFMQFIRTDNSLPYSSGAVASDNNIHK